MSDPSTSALALIELTQHQCAERLQHAAFGRVALSSGALPVILPVHFALLDGDPVFRTDPGTKLMAASAGAVLCFEIDEHDPVLHTGWSVLVTGRAEVITDPVELAAAAALPLRPWIGAGTAYVRIRTAAMSGREIRIQGAESGRSCRPA
jgi:nitroimidazol reductase NimA-like FMN-containing flavoprotein (pyridoxamine 5'-phosphate oxidase superfamily)